MPTTRIAPRLLAATSHARLERPRANDAAKDAGTNGVNDAAPIAAPEPTHAPPAIAPELQRAFSTMRASGEGDAQARLLSDNVEAWNARWELLESATKSIDTSYFTITRDAFGYAYLGALLKKQRDGVRVRLLIDAMADAIGSQFKIAGREYLSELVRAGAEVRVFHPVWQRLPKLSGHAGLAQNHDKILVVDGVRAITGGRNIGTDYFADPNDMPEAWRDTDVLIDGAAPVAGLVKAIDEEVDDPMLARAVGDGLWGDLMKRDVEMLGARLLMDLWLTQPPMSDAKKAALNVDASGRARLARALVEEAVARLPAEGVSRAPDYHELVTLDEIARELVTHVEIAGSQAQYRAREGARDVQARILDRTSAADPEVAEIGDALVQAADAAKETLLIQNPYVVLTEPMLQALERAARRGVQITIVTNSPASTDSAVTQAFFLEDWPYVLARLPNARIFVFTGERKMHAKVAVADDVMSLVSTYNMDLLSSRINGEVGALIWSDAFARDLVRSIEADRADPRNAVREYRIRRDASGEAVLEGGAPIVEAGPADHVPAKTLARYAIAQKVCNVARKVVPHLRLLDHPPLEETRRG